jgi:hypothetical protein
VILDERSFTRGWTAETQGSMKIHVHDSRVMRGIVLPLASTRSLQVDVWEGKESLPETGLPDCTTVATKRLWTASMVFRRLPLWLGKPSMRLLVLLVLTGVLST